MVFPGVLGTRALDGIRGGAFRGVSRTWHFLVDERLFPLSRVRLNGFRLNFLRFSERKKVMVV